MDANWPYLAIYNYQLPVALNKTLQLHQLNSAINIEIKKQSHNIQTVHTHTCTERKREIHMYVNTHAIVIEMYKMLTAINYYKSGLPEAAEQKFSMCQWKII